MTAPAKTPVDPTIKMVLAASAPGSAVVKKSLKTRLRRLARDYTFDFGAFERLAALQRALGIKAVAVAFPWRALKEGYRRLYSEAL